MLLKLPAILAALTVFAATSATAASFEEGRHYTVIAEEASAEPTVMEFFSYGCGGCFLFEPYFARAKTVVGDRAEVMYVPVDFGSGFWTPAQELFLVMEALGKREELHQDAFRFIHGERNAITEANARKFMERHGVSEEQYDAARKSFAVHVKEQRYDQLTRRFRIGSTPTVIVNGKYQVKHDAVSGPEEFAKLIEFLLANP